MKAFTKAVCTQQVVTVTDDFECFITMVLMHIILLLSGNCFYFWFARLADLSNAAKMQ